MGLVQSKVVYTGDFWALKTCSRQGIWSIREDLQLPSSPYILTNAQGQGPPLMVQERFQSVASQLFQHIWLSDLDPANEDLASSLKLR